MTAHSADFGVGVSASPAQHPKPSDFSSRPGSWLDRFSLVKKLYLAVFGNTLVLALVALFPALALWLPEQVFGI